MPVGRLSVTYLPGLKPLTQPAIRSCKCPAVWAKISRPGISLPPFLEEGKEEPCSIAGSKATEIPVIEVQKHGH